MSQLWGIFDTATQERVTVAGFLSKASAERQIEEWQARQDKGGRPDVDASNLVALVVEYSSFRRSNRPC